MLLSRDSEGVAMNTIKALAETLGVTVGWLSSGEGDPPEPGHIRKHVESLGVKVAPTTDSPAPTGTDGAR